MRVLFLTCGPTSDPASRYRVYQYLKYLEAQGIQCTVMSAISSNLRRKFYYPAKGFFYKLLYFACVTFFRLAVLPHLGKYDIIFTQQAALPLLYPFPEILIYRKAHRLHKKVIFDFDDLISDASPGKKSLFYYFRDIHRARRILGGCDKIIAGNDFLKQQASRFNKNGTVIPTSIDLEKFRFKLPKRETKYPIAIGWMGSPGGFLYLNILWGVFKMLALKYDILIKIVGATGKEKEIPGLELEYEEWSLEKEVEQLHAFDIGIMPLTDDERSRGKCGLKLLQYMAAGIPAVASSVGVNKKIISDGINGYLAMGKDEWVKKLEKLILNPELREKFAKNGRVTVEKDFSLRKNSKRLIRVLEEVYNSNLRDYYAGSLKDS